MSQDGLGPTVRAGSRAAGSPEQSNKILQNFEPTDVQYESGGMTGWHEADLASVWGRRLSYDAIPAISAYRAYVPSPIIG